MIRRELRARVLRTNKRPRQGLDILKSLQKEFAIAKANNLIGVLTEQEQFEIDEALEGIRTSMSVPSSLPKDREALEILKALANALKCENEQLLQHVDAMTKQAVDARVKSAASFQSNVEADDVLKANDVKVIELEKALENLEHQTKDSEAALSTKSEAIEKAKNGDLQRRMKMSEHDVAETRALEIERGRAFVTTEEHYHRVRFIASAAEAKRNFDMLFTEATASVRRSGDVHSLRVQLAEAHAACATAEKAATKENALNQPSGTSVAARAFEIEKFELQQEIRDLKNRLLMKSPPTKEDEQVQNLVRNDSSTAVKVVDEKLKQTSRSVSVKETRTAATAVSTSSMMSMPPPFSHSMSPTVQSPGPVRTWNDLLRFCDESDKVRALLPDADALLGPPPTPFFLEDVVAAGLASATWDIILRGIEPDDLLSNKDSHGDLTWVEVLRTCVVAPNEAASESSDDVYSHYTLPAAAALVVALLCHHGERSLCEVLMATSETVPILGLLTILLSVPMEGSGIETVFACVKEYGLRKIVSALCVAASHEYDAGVRRMLSLLTPTETQTLLDAARDTTDANAVTLLHIAARGGNAAVIEFLATSDDVVARRDRWGCTPVFRACEKGKGAVMPFFIAKFPSTLDITDANCCSPFWMACNKGHAHVAELLATVSKVITLEERITAMYQEFNPSKLSDLPDVFKRYKGNEITLLHALIRKYGPEPHIALQQATDLADDRGVTPLFTACTNGHTEVVSLLLRLNPASCDSTNKDGFTPCHLACVAGHIGVVTVLLQFKPELAGAIVNGNITLYHIACHNGHLGILKFLFETHPAVLDINTTDNASPLFLACQYGRTEIVKFLLSVKPSLLEVNRGGNTTPCFAACQNGHVEVVKVLVATKPSILDVKSAGNISPCWIACLNGHLEVVRHVCTKNPLLLDVCAAEGKESPLCAACRTGQVDVVRWVILSGVRKGILDATRADGHTCMSVAAMGGHLEIVQFLFSVKKELLKKKVGGMLPVDLCHMHPEVVAFLKSSQKAEESAQKSKKWF